MIEILFVVLTGLAFGSFVTLASWRLPRGEDIAVKPSRCPDCDTKLTFSDLWPVVSWLSSRGKCRHCGRPVSPRYPLTELATAILFVLVYAQAGLTLAGLMLALFAVALMIMVVVDLEHFIIPDPLHLVLLPLGLAYHFIIGTPWEQVSAGFVAGLVTGLLLHHGYRFLRKQEGLGYGDVKFLAVAGLWIGALPLVPFLFFSGIFGTLTGLIWRRLGRGPIFPFGPALAASLFICVLYPDIPEIFWHMGDMINNLFFS